MSDYLPALEYAKLLCHKLARVTSGPAYVVNDNGHAMLATPEDIGVYWQASQIVYTADCAPPTFAAVLQMELV